MISPNIFRLYDIRGVVDRDLSEEAAYKIARALAQAAQRDGIKCFWVGTIGYPRPA